MQARRLHIVDQRPTMFTAGGQSAEKQIEQKQSQAADYPATKEFSQEQFGPRQRLGQQWQEGSVFLFGKNLSVRGPELNHQPSDPDQPKADCVVEAHKNLV